MSMDDCVIQGTFADFKLVKTRSVAVLCIEIPIERAASAIEMFGVPQPGAEIHVAIARLVQPATESDGSKMDPPPSLDASAQNRRPSDTSSDKSLAAKDRYRALPAWGKAQTRASMLPKDMRFRQWASRQSHPVFGTSGVMDETGAVQFIRTKIGGSRSLIGSEKDAYDAFIAMEAAYLQATGQLAEAR